MRSFARNSAAEPIIEALIAGHQVGEEDARLWIRNILTVEREGFSQRITRRLTEARYYHHGASPRAALHPDQEELLSSLKVLKIIKEETTR